MYAIQPPYTGGVTRRVGCMAVFGLHGAVCVYGLLSHTTSSIGQYSETIYHYEASGTNVVEVPRMLSDAAALLLRRAWRKRGETGGGEGGCATWMLASRSEGARSGFENRFW